MRTQGRRRLDLALIGVGGLAVAGLSAFGGLVGNGEQIDRMWVGATFDGSQTAGVHEVIDYDFGAMASDKHGLERRIPGVTADLPLQSSSPDAPAGIDSIIPTTVGGVPGVRIRIGDAATTVTGHHRYLLSYPIDTLVNGKAIAWDAVGTEWDYDVDESEIHLVAPFAFDDVKCQVGKVGSVTACKIDQPQPGHLVAHVGKTTPGHGVTVRAVQGRALPTAPALPNPPASRPADDGAGLAMPAAAALVASIGAGAAMSRSVRRAGRERVGAGGAADAAWTEGSTTTSEVRLDAKELAEMATTDFAPPEGLTPAQGGVIHQESVHPNHKVAWLIQAAIDGAVELVEEGGKTVKIRRTAPGRAEIQPILDTAFGGRDEITLGSYDSTFAAGWSQVGASLEVWAHSDELWDPRGDRHRLWVRVLGVVFGALGLVGVVGGGALAASDGMVALDVIGALVAGAGIAAVIRGWELRVRTPKGSGLWLRVESFRRFLAGSESIHAEEAAKRGLLREYTAWAVSLDELDRWTRAVNASTVIPQDAGLNYVFIAPMLFSSTSHAATAPSSSGGSGGGGVGGGGGGGGGGSW
jgi:hypothetical protein